MHRACLFASHDNTSQNTEHISTCYSPSCLPNCRQIVNMKNMLSLFKPTKKKIKSCTVNSATISWCRSKLSRKSHCLFLSQFTGSALPFCFLDKHSPEDLFLGSFLFFISWLHKRVDSSQDKALLVQFFQLSWKIIQGGELDCRWSWQLSWKQKEIGQ